MKKLLTNFLYPISLLIVAIAVTGLSTGHLSLAINTESLNVATEDSTKNTAPFTHVANSTSENVSKVKSASFGDIGATIANPHGSGPFYDEEANLAEWALPATTCEEIIKNEYESRQRTLNKTGLGMSTWSLPEQRVTTPNYTLTDLTYSFVGDVSAQISVVDVDRDKKQIKHPTLLSVTADSEDPEKKARLEILHALLLKYKKKYSDTSKYRWYYTNYTNKAISIQCRLLEESEPFFSANLETFYYNMRKPLEETSEAVVMRQ